MKKPPSEPQIDLIAQSHDEQGRRLVVARDDSETVEIDKLGDTVRIERKPRAKTPQREMLRQPWICD